ncbi:hypothetical protein NJBCHELONAE_25290 [Mycobacteroides chelonae]|uniref:WXG100 family type VII secretion target n=1 Tax=Mycobacteroides chelonae TaxID=1774 RepID=UPI0021DBF10A|nr:WXG100 family type VII secretion target [Mycobacteroides chelonae]GLE57221.1 hypothetical protein NJBCHELONAE_25290 [Mycobacteroides chelonae]
MATRSSADGDGLAIRVPEVITSAQGIDNVNSDIQNAFNRLKTEGDEVIDGSWTGTAADKLDEGWQQWQQGVYRIVNALEAVNGLVIGSANSFQHADQGGS